MVLVIIAGCSADSPPSAPGAGTGSGGVAVALTPFDLDAFHAAEAKLRADGREKAGLAKLGPGAVELAGFMDRTATFLLLQAPARMTKARSSSGGRLAGLPPPGSALVGAYATTVVVFESLVSQRPGDLKGTQPTGEKCPCTKSETLDPTTDQVEVAGNKGTITTTMSFSATVNGSKVSVTIKIKIEGEVRDAATGAVLYKIASEGTGHAEGDVCPDTSGVANASMTFGAREDYFDSSGAKVGTGVIENFGGPIRMKVDDNAKLSGVDITATGGGVFGEALLSNAARGVAPSFEKAWRSGICIAVLVSPEDKDVDPGSVTEITAKVRHKIEGNELDKPVEAKLESGVKTVEPSGTKQKAPATFRHTAGDQPGDKGGISFDSVSNRGIGHTFATYTVGGGWTISATGTSHEDFQGVVSNALRVTIKDLKVTAAKEGPLTGSGTMTISGPVTAGGGFCKGNLDQTLPITATGTLVGTGPGAVLRLTLFTQAQPGVTVVMTCSIMGSPPISQTLGAEGHSDRYGEALGAIELPADGGTKSIDRTAAIGGVMNVAATGTFTVVKGQKK